MFRYANSLLAALVLIAGGSGCSSMNSCGGGCNSCGGDYGSCGGGCDTCSSGCDNGCGHDYSSWYPWNWFSHGGEEWCGCSSCGPTYWGDKDSDCSPCDQCGNYVGYGQPAVGYQQPTMGDEYAASHSRSNSYQNAYANNRARPMSYPPMNEPAMARQPRMMPAQQMMPAQPQYEEQDPQIAEQPQYAPQPKYAPQPRNAPQPNYAQQRYAQQPHYAQQPQYVQRPTPAPQPRSVRTYARPDDQFSARAGSRGEGDAPSVSSNMSRQSKLNPYNEAPASATQPVAPQDDRRVNRVSYEERVAPPAQQPAPRGQQPAASQMKDPWAWMYAE